jgi:outer membrane lipoprotein SlyB
MKKIILASVSSLALLGLAACSDTDTTTTQSVEPEVQETAPTVTPGTDTNVIVVPETDDTTPADGTTTQSITPENDTLDGDDATGAAPGGTIGTDDVEPADDVPAVQ